MRGAVQVIALEAVVGCHIYLKCIGRVYSVFSKYLKDNVTVLKFYSGYICPGFKP